MTNVAALRGLARSASISRRIATSAAMLADSADSAAARPLPRRCEASSREPTARSPTGSSSQSASSRSARSVGTRARSLATSAPTGSASGAGTVRWLATSVCSRLVPAVSTPDSRSDQSDSAWRRTTACSSRRWPARIRGTPSTNAGPMTAATGQPVSA